jgi:hypothetical protein
MGIKVLHKHHCKVTFLIKDGDYLPIESSFVTKKIAEIIKKYKDSYVEENFKKENVTASKEEIINLQKMLFDVTFGDYLADKATSEGSYEKNVIYYSKLEEILFNDLKNAIEKDKSLTNYHLENTKDWEFENTVSTILTIATNFEKNLNIKSQQESNQDITYLLDWKTSLLNKFLLIKNESPKLIFRLSDINLIDVTNTQDTKNFIVFNLKGKKLSFSFSQNFKIRRRNDFST